MDAAALERVHEAFQEFDAYFASAFGRRQWRERSGQYLQALLVQSEERRNAENLPEAVAATPRVLQRFLTEARWDDDAVVGWLQEYLKPRLADPQGVWVLDGSDFPKQGVKSVGVARQYCGTLGKIANCQAGVFLAHVGPKGRALVDKRLYLPQEWTGDWDRCAAAGVPAERRTYRSKTELALEMVERAQARGHLRAQWVAGDSAFGMSPNLREGLAAAGMRYVLDVRPDMTVRPLEPAWTDPPYQGNGRPRKPRLRGGQRETCKSGPRQSLLMTGGRPRWLKATRGHAPTVTAPSGSEQPSDASPVKSSGQSIVRTWMAVNPTTTCPTRPTTRPLRPWPTWAAPDGTSKPSSRPRRATWTWTSTRPAPGPAGTITSPCACWLGLSC